MPVRLSLRDFLLVVLVVIIWGFAFVPMRWALAETPPLLLACLRFACAALPAVFFVRRPATGWATIVGYGFAIGVLQFGLLFTGMQLGMPAGLSSLVIQTQVFFTIGLAAWWLHDRLDRASLVGATVAGAGIALLAWYKLTAGATTTFTGFLLVIGAAASWAVGNVLAKRAAGRADVDMLGLVVWSSLVAPVPLAIASWALEGGPRLVGVVRDMSWRPWACVLFMSYFATLFSLARWNALLHRYPTAVIAPFALLIPVAGLASGSLFLDERLSPVQYAGVGLVLAGLAWNVFGARARAWLARMAD
ncbi:MAG: EamA family transporter [Burkholderiales bacterium]